MKSQRSRCGGALTTIAATCRYAIFFLTDTASTEIYTLSLHDALPIWRVDPRQRGPAHRRAVPHDDVQRSEEHTSELQSRFDLVCRLLLEKKNAGRSCEPVGVDTLQICSSGLLQFNGICLPWLSPFAFV